jgi:type II secretory pathway pseudopilin PulG
MQPVVEAYDLKNNLVLPGKTEEANVRIGSLKPSWSSPYNFLASWALPNYTRATQTLARNQIMVNQAFVVCALERYRLAQGAYPETLDALVPRFADKLPHDIIGGQPLKYRRMEDPPSQSSGAASGKFLLYSVGWNEKDDGGQVVLNDGRPGLEQGDWVWPMPSK